MTYQTFIFWCCWKGDRSKLCWNKSTYFKNKIRMLRKASLSLESSNHCMLDSCREGGLMINWINYYSPTITWLENWPWMSWCRFDVGCTVFPNRMGILQRCHVKKPIKTNPLRRQFPAKTKQSLGGATKFATKPMEFQAKKKVLPSYNNILERLTTRWKWMEMVISTYLSCKEFESSNWNNHL